MIRVQSFSEAGGHPENEDAFAVRTHPNDSGLWLAFVADGQGGRAGGGPAARLACETAVKSACDCRPKSLLEPATWKGILRTADLAVANDSTAGFTTLVGLCVSGTRIVGASSGDSAALLVNRGGKRVLTAYQAKNPPIGSGSATAVLFAAETGEDWQLLLMTDGVWKYVGWNRIYDMVRRMRGPELSNEMQGAARLPATGLFQDDFTLVTLDGVEAAETDSTAID